MKKITIEFDSQSDLEYHLEQYDKGFKLDNIDEYLRALVKYDGIESLIKTAKENHEHDHKSYGDKTNYKKPGTEEMVSEILQIIRRKIYLED